MEQVEIHIWGGYAISFLLFAFIGFNVAALQVYDLVKAGFKRWFK